MKLSTLILSSVALLVGVTSHAQVQHFGYYHLGSSVGQYSTGDATLVQTDSYDYDSMDANRSVSIKSFVSNLFSNFFDRGSGCVGIKSASDSGFAAWASQIESRGLVPHIGAFYLADEPYLNLSDPTKRGCTYAQISAMLSLAAQVVKARFPSVPIALVDAYVIANPSFPSTFPPELDWVGFNCYPFGAGLQSSCGGSLSIEAFLATLKQKLHPHQKIIVVPQAFDVVVNLDPNLPSSLDQRLTGQQMAGLAADFVRLALAEPRTVAVMAFLGNRSPWLSHGLWYRGVRSPSLESDCGSLGGNSRSECFAMFSARQPARRTFESLVKMLRGSSAGHVNVVLNRPVSSLLPESPAYSSPGSFAVDGSFGTRAYPGNVAYRYRIDLGKVCTTTAPTAPERIGATVVS
jgi:hypothetical protein